MLYSEATLQTIGVGASDEFQSTIHVDEPDFFDEDEVRENFITPEVASPEYYEEYAESPVYSSSTQTTREEIIEKIATIISTLKLSQKQMDQVWDASDLISKYRITTSEVNEFSSKVLENFASPKTTRHCSGCLQSLLSSTSQCCNVGCSFYKMKCRRGSKTQQTVVTTFSVRLQLQKVISNQFSMLYHTHLLHHSLGVDEKHKYSSLHLSNFYAQNMESKFEFERERHMRLPMSLFIDGFVPRNSSKVELTPMFARIEGVPKQNKESEGAVVLAAIHNGPDGIHHKNADIFGSRLATELESIKMRPISITFRNEIWTVELKTVMAVLDAKASRSLFGIPNWAALDGCFFCDVNGTRVGRSAVSFHTEHPATLRSGEDLVDLIREKGKENVFLSMINPLCQPVDELHVVAEGVLKRLLEDMTGRSKHWIELKLRSTVVAQLDQCMLTLKNHAGCRSELLSFSRIGKMTGSQLRQTCRICFTAIALTHVYPDVYVSIFLIFLVRYIDLLMSIENGADFEKLKEMRNYLKSFITCRHSSECTYKLHVLVDHSVEMVEKFGNLTGTSSSPFEKFHRLISIDYNQFSTSVEDMGKKFLLKKALKHELSVKRFFWLGPDVEVSPVFEITQQDEIARLSEKLNENFHDVRFWKRIQLRNQLLTSESWKIGKFETIIRAKYNEEHYIGHAEAFFSCDGGVYVILRKINVRDPVQLLYNTARACQVDDDILDDLWMLKCENNWIFEYIGQGETVLLPIHTVVSRFLSFKMRSRSFLMETHN